ncbi:MAG: hypothetical protein A2X49_00385 [Lentisphaerae bacterium GWF2_52_8]|nr:MAG: hypothetical protein A2X49_00385 [Lentisphaerae bacterium GWF2_52_8]
MRRFTQLGAGFRLALRDLEIRGTGNLLGPEQSGQINSIGFDLYCQLLKATVAQLQGNPEKILPELNISVGFIHLGHKAPQGMLAAGIPPSYIPSEKLRLEAYRRLGRVQSLAEIDGLSEEWSDRFGRLPESVGNLLELARIRVNAAEAGYHSLGVKDGKLFLEGPRGLYRKEGKVPVLPRFQSLPVLLAWILDLSQRALRERLALS